MTDWNQLRSVEQIAAERARLQKKADQQAQNLLKDTHEIRQTWQKRAAGVERFANMMSLVMPKIGRGTVLLTILTRIFRRFRR